MKTILTFFTLLACVVTVSLAQGVCAHRGDNKSAPENTIPAILSAVRKGAHQIEFDVCPTKDGELVVIHDSSVDRTTDGTGKIGDMTLAEIKKLDAGSWFDRAFAETQIPTFRQALEAVPEHILCNVEIKGGPETAVKAAIIIAGKGRTGQCFLTIPTHADEVAIAARTEVPDIMICKGFPAEETIQPADLRIKTADSNVSVNLDIDFFQLFYFKSEPVPYDHIKKTMSTLHRQGVRANYCCSSKEDGIRQLRSTGVDFILTDDVDLCLKVLGEKP